MVVVVFIFVFIVVFIFVFIFVFIVSVLPPVPVHVPHVLGPKLKQAAMWQCTNFTNRPASELAWGVPKKHIFSASANGSATSPLQPAELPLYRSMAFRPAARSAICSRRANRGTEATKRAGGPLPGTNKGREFFEFMPKSKSQ